MNQQASSPNDLATFHVSRNDLEDDSATFDVYASAADGQILIAEPASETTAIYLAESLETIRTLFLNCGSDREVMSLVVALDKVYGTISKKAA